MSNVSILVNEFPDLDQIKSEDLVSYLPKSLDIKLIDNILGNMLLYPDTIPQSIFDNHFEVALLTQAVKIHAKNYYHLPSRKIFIPESLITRVSNFMDLIWIFINALKPYDINTIYLKQNSGEVKILGTYIKPQIISKVGEIDLEIENQLYSIKLDYITTIPETAHKVDIKFNSKQATLLDKNIVSAEVSGGLVGLILDTKITN